ncbi:ester cyclase [Nocardia sp. BMG51109]|uniref:ester cyclase n=1 Tax=Nocardia sp. BMG51109 TaxID=1056816 RepID=UPI0004654AD3|nr:ester cyclase [Nocardia sp. BMG51109]
MSPEDNQRTVQRFYEEVLNGGNVDLIDNMVTKDHRSWETTDPVGNGKPGAHNLKRWVLEKRAAFPDIEVIVDEWIVQGDFVVSRWTCRGTHTGEDFEGIPPMGAKINVMGVAIDRFEGDRTAESWLFFDGLDFAKQLGASMIPGPRVVKQIMTNRVKSLF